jgi:hypothetical protein
METTMITQSTLARFCWQLVAEMGHSNNSPILVAADAAGSAALASLGVSTDEIYFDNSSLIGAHLLPDSMTEEDVTALRDELFSLVSSASPPRNES